MVIKVVVEVEVRPTENPNKVRRAIKNVFVPVKYSLVKQGEIRIMRAEGFGSSSLVKLHKLLREEKILDAARRYLKAGVKGRRIEFMLHKQAAYAGIVTFCDEEIDSPLGPIKFIIECDNPSDLINWLAPPTVNGVPVREYPPPD